LGAFQKSGRFGGQHTILSPAESSGNLKFECGKTDFLHPVRQLGDKIPVEIILKQHQTIEGANHDMMSKPRIIDSGFLWYGDNIIFDTVPTSVS